MLWVVWVHDYFKLVSSGSQPLIDFGTRVEKLRLFWILIEITVRGDGWVPISLVLPHAQVWVAQLCGPQDRTNVYLAITPPWACSDLTAIPNG